MKIGIIAAMEPEVKHIIEALENKEKHTIANIDIYEGKIKNHTVIVSLSGIGKVNSSINTTILIDHFKPDFVINSGIAGGSRGLKTFDLVVADKLTYSDFDCQIFGYQFGQVPQMPQFFYSNKEYRTLFENYLTNKKLPFKTSTILTADSFRMSACEIKNEIDTVYAVEMEGTSIAQTCYKLNTPFLSIRIISDILDSNDHIEEYNKFESESAKISSDIIVNFIQTL